MCGKLQDMWMFKKEPVGYARVPQNTEQNTNEVIRILKPFLEEITLLKLHLQQLKSKSAVRRFKYYVKKRVRSHLKDIDILELPLALQFYNKEAMSLLNKISSKSNSGLVKLYKLLRRSNNIKTIIDKSTISLNEYQTYNRLLEKQTAFKFNDNHMPEEAERVAIEVFHLKRYLATIPPTSISEYVAFRNLFEVRILPFSQLSKNNLKLNINDIWKTLAFRIKNRVFKKNIKKTEEIEQRSKLEKDLKKRGALEAKHYYSVAKAHHDTRPKWMSLLERSRRKMKEAKDKKKARNRIEANMRVKAILNDKNSKFQNAVVKGESMRKIRQSKMMKDTLKYAFKDLHEYGMPGRDNRLKKIKREQSIQTAVNEEHKKKMKKYKNIMKRREQLMPLSATPSPPATGYKQMKAMVDEALSRPVEPIHSKSRQKHQNSRPDKNYFLQAPLPFAMNRRQKHQNSRPDMIQFSKDKNKLSQAPLIEGWGDWSDWVGWWK